MGEDTRRRAAEDDAALEAARERERAGRRTYRLVGDCVEIKLLSP